MSQLARQNRNLTTVVDIVGDQVADKAALGASRMIGF
jgi:hypothetical protein